MSDNSSGEQKRPHEEADNNGADAGAAGGGGGGDAKKPKKPPGTVLFSGATDWDEVGRSKNNSLARSNNTVWKPVKLQALSDVDVCAVASGCTSVHMFALTSDGRVFGWGRNEKGQLGLGHARDRKCPTQITDMDDKKVVAAATGRNHSLLLTDSGEVYSCGDNRFGQCGVGDKHEVTVTSPRKVNYPGGPAVAVSCGAEFSALVDSEGQVWTWGHPEHGQLGHNTEGSFLEKSGKVTFDFVHTPTRVVLYVEKDPRTKQATPVLGVSARDVACGANHCVAVDDKGRAYSWGFGGYGRLGHSETGDEMVPRMIKFFDGPRRGVSKVYAGGQFNLATAEVKGTTYMWGQYNSTKEANMYPKPIPDLSGWMDVRSIGCSGKGWILSADDSVIAACPSPCYGELAMGENKKSSANPIEVKTLADIFIEQVAMGQAHSLFLARPSDEKEQKKLDSMEVLDQSDQDK